MGELLAVVIDRSTASRRTAFIVVSAPFAASSRHLDRNLTNGP
jgi:hypothetical protein